MVHSSLLLLFSHSVMSDSLRPHGLQPTRLLHPWDFPGNSTGVGCHCLLRYMAYVRTNKTGKKRLIPTINVIQEKAQTPEKRILDQPTVLEHSQIKGVHSDGWGLGAQLSWVRLRDSSSWVVPTRVPAFSQCPCRYIVVLLSPKQ